MTVQVLLFSHMHSHYARCGKPLVSLKFCAVPRHWWMTHFKSRGPSWMQNTDLKEGTVVWYSISDTCRRHVLYGSPEFCFWFHMPLTLLMNY